MNSWRWLRLWKEYRHFSLWVDPAALLCEHLSGRASESKNASDHRWCSVRVGIRSRCLCAAALVSTSIWALNIWKPETQADNRITSDGSDWNSVRRQSTWILMRKLLLFRVNGWWVVYSRLSWKHLTDCRSGCPDHERQRKHAFQNWLHQVLLRWWTTTIRRVNSSSDPDFTN